MRFRALFASGLVVVAAASAHAQTADMVSFQGLIRDSGGTPIVTTVSLEFRIFTADTGGTLVDMDGDGILEGTAASSGGGTDVILVGPLTPNGGIVSTKFGPVSPKAFAGCTPSVAGCRWLEVTVVGSATPLSRLEMVTPPGAAEQVNALQSGNGAIFTNSAENVGIGTIGPAAKLDVRATGDTSPTTGTPIARFRRGDSTVDYLAIFGDAVGNYIVADDAGSNSKELRLQTRNNKNILLEPNGTGQVGIGTTSPTARLDVAGGARINDSLVIDDFSLPYSPFVQFRENGQSKWLIGRTVAGSDYFSINYNGLGIPFFIKDGAPSNSLMISAAGNIGIGTTTPSQKLELSGIFHLNGTFSDPPVDSSFYMWTQAGFGARYSAFQHRFDVSGDLPGGVRTEAMRIDSAGNVGIGTSSPSARLHVAGSIIASGCTGCSSDARLKTNIATVTTALITPSDKQ